MGDEHVRDLNMDARGPDLVTFDSVAQYGTERQSPADARPVSGLLAWLASLCAAVLTRRCWGNRTLRLWLAVVAVLPFTVNVAIALAPIVNPVSATVAYGSSANPIPPIVTGGSATSIAIFSAAAHGTATSGGTSITYTPAVGFAGTDTFTYTATNADGTSSPAMITITISPPSIVYSPPGPAPGYLGVAYSQSVAGASGGATPYSYVTAGPVPPAQPWRPTGC